jgi:hypothetical protein
LRLQPSQLPAIHCHVCSNSPFSIKALNKIKFHVAPSSDVTAATAAGDRSKSTCNELSARGPRMERRREWQRMARCCATPAHAIGGRQLRRQSSRCYCSTCPTPHVSITRTAIAQHCTSARLTLVKHGLALVLAAHFHGLEPREAVLELGAHFINARTRISRVQLAKPVHNVTKCSGQRRSSGARRQKYTFSSGGGGGICCCCCCRCFSRDRISKDMQ